MNVGLLLIAREAAPATTNRTGRTTHPGSDAHVICTTSPGTTWTVTDPALLEAAARELDDAAAWLRDQTTTRKDAT